MKALIFTVSMAFTLNAYAEANTPAAVATPTTDSAVKAMTGTAKKSRKKKEVMCAECGKPESQCECKGEEHRKTDSNQHKEGEEHSEGQKKK